MKTTSSILRDRFKIAIQRPRKICSMPALAPALAKIDQHEKVW
jgi:hypothetical protein